MKIHKNTKLLPYQRKAIWKTYHDDKESVYSLAMTLSDQQSNDKTERIIRTLMEM